MLAARQGRTTITNVMFKSVVQIVEQARLYPAATQPAGTHQSYPVPVYGTKGVELAFMYCRAMILKAREGLQLWPPSYVATLAATTGRFDRLKAVRPGDFRQAHAIDSPIGKYLAPAEREADTFLTKLARLYQAYDLLLPSFALRSGQLSGDTREAVLEFRDLFQQIAEAPLLPYYVYLGREFFAWLDAVGIPGEFKRDPVGGISGGR
jgi:hypothetical protein